MKVLNLRLLSRLPVLIALRSNIDLRAQITFVEEGLFERNAALVPEVDTEQQDNLPP